MNCYLGESESSWHLWEALQAIPMKILIDTDLQNDFSFAEYS